tara:strand:- start:978 stop:1541 length:564 start_codon:yes stop_codon:yes gene_type:complete
VSERQKHGFKFESQVINDLNLTPETSYTAEWDAYDSNDTPISIKCIASTGTIDCGSVVRMFKHFKSPGWDMILGRHANKVLKAVYRYSFTKEVCDALIGDLTLEDVQTFDRNIKSFKQGYHTEARKYAKDWKAEYKSKTGLLTVQPKIDSKTQRRVQCGINQTALSKLFSSTPYDSLQHLIGVNFGN